MTRFFLSCPAHYFESMKPNPSILSKLSAIGADAAKQYEDDCAEWASIEHLGDCGAPSKDTRQGKHPEFIPGTGFADGERVATCEPDVYFDDAPEAGDERREMLARMLDFLTGDSLEPEQIGRRLLLLASLTGAGRAAELTNLELAGLLKVSPGRVSQIKSNLENSAELNNFATRRTRGKAAQLKAKSRFQNCDEGQKLKSTPL